ncbi:hypothetical protein MKX01_007822 [Papaver californicum]|nr:hypothetical protein MKX01_007822 [Papaver californicum]
MMILDLDFGSENEDEQNNLNLDIKKKTCLTLPYVASDNFKANFVAGKFSTVLKEMIVEHTQDHDENEQKPINGLVLHDMGEHPLCRYFVNGLCNRGSNCPFSNSLLAQRPVCKFFFLSRLLSIINHFHVFKTCLKTKRSIKKEACDNFKHDSLSQGSDSGLV